MCHIGWVGYVIYVIRLLEFNKLLEEILQGVESGATRLLIYNKFVTTEILSPFIKLLLRVVGGGQRTDSLWFRSAAGEVHAHNGFETTQHSAVLQG